MRWSWFLLAVGVSVGCGGGGSAEKSTAKAGKGSPAKDGAVEEPAAPVPAVSPPADGTRLRALRASVGDPTGLFDEDPATRWSVAGDARGDRVEVRPEAPLVADAVSLQACSGDGLTAVTWGLRVNGTDIGVLGVSPSGESTRPLPAGVTVSSLVVEALDALSGACLAGITLHAGEVALPLRPPRAVPGRVRPSSVRTPNEAYHPYYLFDQRPDSSWQDGKVGGGGMGESLTVTLDAPFPLVGVELWNGDQRDAAAFARSARATQVGLSVDKGASLAFPLSDTPGPQQITLPRPVDARAWTLSIAAVAPGEPIPGPPGSRLATVPAPLAVSEVRLVDTSGPVTVRTRDREDRASAVAPSLAASRMKPLLDRQWAAVCPTEGPRTLKLRGDLDAQLSVTVGGRRTVWEGEWAPRDLGKTWSALRVAGREMALAEASAPTGAWGTWVEGVGREGDLEIAAAADLGPEAWMEAVGAYAKTPLAGRFACIADLDPDDAAADFQRLVERKAFLVRGADFADVYAESKP